MEGIQKKAKEKIRREKKSKREKRKKSKRGRKLVKDETDTQFLVPYLSLLLDQKIFLVLKIGKIFGSRKRVKQIEKWYKNQKKKVTHQSVSKEVTSERDSD